MSDESNTYYPPGPAVLYVAPGDPAEVHTLDSPMWRAGRLSFVDRHTLAARLRALADLIDPGPLHVYELNQAVINGAEEVRHP